MKTFFITGGQGFIGYHICKELLKDPENRVVTYDALKYFLPLDDSLWGYYLDYRNKNLRSDRLIKVRGDVVNKSRLEEILKEHKPDVIMHLAALPVAAVSHLNYEESYENILTTTISLLDVIKNLDKKPERLIYTSSSMVYGDFRRDEFGEIISATEDQTCNPKGIYDAMKLCGEILVKTYNKRFSIPYVIVRPSAVYGPTDVNRRVTEIFVMNMLTGKDLILENGGEHMLDFTYVEDLARGFALAATSERALGETFNITRGKGRKIKELADILKNLVPESRSRIISEPANVYRPNRGTLNITKAKTLLGYEPQFSLEEGMKQYVQFIRDTYLKDPNHTF